MRTLILAFILSNTVNVYGQIDLKRKIRFEDENISLGELFNRLESKYGIAVAYGRNNMPLELLLTMEAGVKSLYEIIQIICAKADLSYQIIDHVIVFKYLGRRVSQAVIDQRASSPGEHQIEDPFASTSPQISGQVNDSIRTGPPDAKHSFPQLPSRFRFDLGKVQLPELIPISIPFVARAPRRNKKFQTGLSFSYSVDLNRFRFTERELAFQEYRTEWNQKAGVGGYLLLTPKVYISLGLGYATKNFSLEYNYAVLDPHDPFPIPDATLVKLYYLEIPLTIGYGIFSQKHNSLWLDTGFYPSFLVRADEKTTYKNQADENTVYFLAAKRPVFYAGTIGFIFHRSITHSCGFFFNPSWLYAVGSVNEIAIQSNFGLYRFNAGVQFVLQNRN